MCGKNPYIKVKNCIISGSPPRVREEHLRTLYKRVCNGITPACAGRTYYEGDDTSRCEDHPRVCGKNLRFIFSVNV